MATKGLKSIRPGDFFGSSIIIYPNSSFDFSTPNEGEGLQFDITDMGNTYTIELYFTQVIDAYDYDYYINMDLINSQDVTIDHDSQPYIEEYWNVNSPLELNFHKAMAISTPTITNASAFSENLIRVELYYGKKTLAYLLRKIIAKIESALPDINLLCDRFTTIFDVKDSCAAASGFTLDESVMRLIGTALYTKVRTTKSSNWSTGNITNTTIANGVRKISGYDTNYSKNQFEAVWSQFMLSAPNGGLKSISALFTNTIDKPYWVVNAVDTADKLAAFCGIQILRYKSIF